MDRDELDYLAKPNEWSMPSAV